MLRSVWIRPVGSAVKQKKKPRLLLKSWLLGAVALCLTSSVAQGQHTVYDTLTTSSIFWGRGAYAIDNLNNASTLATYNGGSPAFEFVPFGIQAGDVLNSFNVAIGNDLIAGQYNFTLTLFTSGSAEELNPQNWTQLGSWGGKTDGSFNSNSHTPVTVSATPIVLTNGTHYYLMATADANQGLDGSGDNNLDWGYISGSLPAWEVLLDGYRDRPLRASGAQGAMQVIVGPSVASVPELSSMVHLSLFLGIGATGCLLRRSRLNRA